MKTLFSILFPLIFLIVSCGRQASAHSDSGKKQLYFYNGDKFALYDEKTVTVYDKNGNDFRLSREFSREEVSVLGKTSPVLYTVDTNYRIVRHDLVNGVEKQIDRFFGPVLQLDLDKNETNLYVLSANGNLASYDLVTGVIMMGSFEEIQSFTLNEENHVVFLLMKNKIKVIDMATKKDVSEFFYSK